MSYKMYKNDKNIFKPTNYVTYKNKNIIYFRQERKETQRANADLL